MSSVPENIKDLSHLLENAAKENDEDGWKRFRLPNGQLARMSFSYKGGRGLRYGFRSVRVTLETPKAEKAIFAALVALKGERVEAERLRYAAILADSIDKAQTSEYSPSRDWAQSLDENPRLRKATAKDWKGVPTVRFVSELLGHYRPEFAELPAHEQVALLEKAASYVNEYLEALRKMTAFFEYGDPYEGIPKNTVKKAEQYLEAAELKDIMGLRQREVGAALGLPLSDRDQTYGGHARANQFVREGRKIFKEALGEDGYREYIEAKKAEVERWRSLSVEKRHAELNAEIFDVPADSVLRIMTGDFEEEVSKLEPDKRLAAVYIRAVYETWELPDDPDQPLTPRTEGQ